MAHEDSSCAEFRRVKTAWRILEHTSPLSKKTSRNCLRYRVGRLGQYILFASLLAGGPVTAAGESVGGPDRSPLAVAVSPDGRRCLSANHTSNSVALVDLVHGQVIAEQACGDGPAGIVWTTEQTALVCLRGEDSVAVLGVEGPRISVHARIAVGDEPCAVALSSTQAGGPPRAFVALAGQDQVVVLNLLRQRVSHRIKVGQQPSSVAISPNGNWLLTACSLPGEVLVHDAATYALISRRELLDETGNVGTVAVLPDSSACIVPHIVNRTFPVNAENIEKGWVIDNRLSKLTLPAGEMWDQAQLGLDKRGDAVGDAHAAVVSPDGKWLAVSCGGTHELLIFHQPDVPWPPADPGDFIPDELLRDDGRFRRIELGGRPLGAAFIDDRTVVVANYLLNALQCVDVAAGKVIRTIHLGGPATPSLARRGAAIYYDADRSLNSWFSCHTCHPDGHTCGLTFDTLNDGAYNTQKLTPSLRGVAHTAPWTWHGWQTDLAAAMRKSLTSTMQSRQRPTDADAQALVAFLSTLDFPTSPQRAASGQLTTAAERGQRLFEAKAGCVRCHQRPYFTSPRTFDIGLSSTANPQEYNPPSLLGIYARRRFLHDGRARSLHEVLNRHHRPADVGDAALSDRELNDLIAYLKSL